MEFLQWLWLGAVVLFAVIEAATVTLVSLWFIGGSLAALICALLGGALWLQVVLFFAVSAILLLALRPLAKKAWAPRQAAMNAGGNVGKTAVVQEPIDNLLETGTIKLSGVVWAARSENGEKLPAGSVVKVLRIEGVRLFVAPINEHKED